MKKITRYIVPVIVACLGLQGCSNLLTKIADTGTDASSSGTVPVTICVAGQDSASSSVRTILPDAASSIVGYELYCGTSGAAQSNLKTFTTLGANSVVNLAAGTWDFTLYAKNSKGVAILSGTKNNVTLAASPVSLSFTLEPQTTGTGTIKVSVTWPDSAGVAKVVPTFNGTEGTALAMTADGDTRSAVYRKSAVTAGGYLISFSLQDSNGKEIASIPEYVRVYGNLESTATFDLTAADFNSAPTEPSDVAAVVSDGTDCDTANVTLTWTDNSTNEKKFEAAYSTDGGSSWTTLSDSAAASETTELTGVSRGKAYAYRIRAVNDFGNSEWDTAAAVSVPFKAPSSLSPADKAATAEIAPALNWDAVNNADHYEIQIADSEDGVADAVILSTTAGTGSTTATFTPSEYPSYFSFWRVRAVDSSGANGGWSSIQAITIGWGSLPVTISGPGTVTTGSTEPSVTTDDTPEFTWDAVNGAVKYELQLATTESAVSSATAIEVSTNGYTPTIENSVLDNNTTYYWRVCAVTNDALNSGTETASLYSPIRHFTVAWLSDGVDGDGPADNIRYIKELQYIAANAGYLDGHYKLGADIDLSSVTSWTPIGSRSKPFSGTFDGNGYTISGLTINSPSSGYQGLFGYASGATFTDVKLIGVSITGSSYNGIGGLSGYCIDCSITECYSSGSISGRTDIGGIVGIYKTDTKAVNISACCSDCSVTGASTNTSYEIGGLIGYAYGKSEDIDITVSGCSATGTISGQGSVGGLVGKIENFITVSDCHATGAVTGTKYLDGDGTGGLIGTLCGHQWVSGSALSCVVEKCYATGTITGCKNVGGLVGSGYYVMYNYSCPGKISCCYAAGNVIGLDNVGGLVGYDVSYSTIDNSFAIGTVDGRSKVGGCVGCLSSFATVSNCYSIGKVSSSNNSAAGFLASSSGTVTVTSCFYDRTTSGQSDTGSGTPEYTSEMQTESTFTSASEGGWDFAGETDNGTDDIWTIDTSAKPKKINNGYPYLSALPPQ
jgi:hypothetical protein